MPFMELRAVARIVARAFLAGELTRAGMRERAAKVLNASPRSVAGLAIRILKQVQEGTRPPRHRLERALIDDKRLKLLVAREGYAKLVKAMPAGSARMIPASGAPCEWPVRPIRSPVELASLLNLTAGELQWFADTRGMEGKVAGVRCGIIAIDGC